MFKLDRAGAVKEKADVLGEKLEALYLAGTAGSASSMYDYFEIFLTRMMMCSRAAEVLDAKFALYVNDQKVL